MRSYDESLEPVRELVTRRLAEHGARVYLFGSFARGDAHRFSDVDIAVDTDRPLPRGTLSLLREELEESSIPRHVQLVDLREADDAFRKRILEEGIPWSVSKSA